MLQLPNEIIYIILDYITLKDWKHVSLTHSRLYQVAKSHLYSSLECPWSSLPDLLQQDFTHYMRKLCAIESGEWKYSLYLRDFVELCPNFTQLSVETLSSSSGWLKYIGPPHLQITSLTLKSTALRGMNLFDFDHVEGMPHLRRIQLHNVQLITPESPHPAIEVIELVNCTWDFPDDIANIGNIKRFSILLTHPLHPFSFSERLQHAATYPPPGLEELSIHLLIGHRVSWKPLTRGSKSIERLSLKGFEKNTYRNLPNLVELTQD